MMPKEVWKPVAGPKGEPGVVKVVDLQNGYFELQVSGTLLALRETIIGGIARMKRDELREVATLMLGMAEPNADISIRG
jgi:hypothetical protein